MVPWQLFLSLFFQRNAQFGHELTAFCTATVKPKKALIIALGAVGGLMLGVFVALLRNLLRPRQTDKP
jgi:capsular polysaccharide biosynthesis protein